ncbi:phospholipase A [Formosa haliotis]|uniref:phospholipase A n=1 Tax=Formosa haliotis TaxID=1555194 RepID=UPI000826B9C9|nr:phospholipase A [Formosa haliotis]
MKYLFILCFSLLIHQQSLAQDSIPLSEQSLEKQWELYDTIGRKSLFKILPYRPTYILVANYSTDINKQPSSENPVNDVPEAIDLDPVEMKFQLSLKTKAIRNIFGKKIGGDIWLAYTQSSRWQIFNKPLSRPFRETNYEPEGFLLFPTRYSIWGLKGVFSGIGFNHQSNGRANPYSRSWNRFMLHFGMSIKDLNIIINPWWRIQEDFVEDNNPNIEDYIGRCEILFTYIKNKHYINLAARHSLRSGDRSHGSLRLDYSYRFYENLKFHVQCFTGYGESLIDYNHKQTTFGIGLSLIQ